MDDSSFFSMAQNESQQKDDASLLVRFEWADVPDQIETAKSGFPCFKRKEQVRIRIAGQEERVHYVTDLDRRRFPRAYEAFKRGAEVPADGTPLKEWAGATSGDVAMLQHFGVASVEQLAALSDEQISSIGHGGRTLRDRAKGWQEAKAKHKPVAALQAELRERDEKLAAMQQTIDAMSARLEAVMAGAPMPTQEAPKRKRGRPAKVALES